MANLISMSLSYNDDKLNELFKPEEGYEKYKIYLEIFSLSQGSRLFRCDNLEIKNGLVVSKVGSPQRRSYTHIQVQEGEGLRVSLLFLVERADEIFEEISACFIPPYRVSREAGPGEIDSAYGIFHWSWGAQNGLQAPLNENYVEDEEAQRVYRVMTDLVFEDELYLIYRDFLFEFMEALSIGLDRILSERGIKDNVWFGENIKEVVSNYSIIPLVLIFYRPLEAIEKEIDVIEKIKSRIEELQQYLAVNEIPVKEGFDRILSEIERVYRNPGQIQQLADVVGKLGLVEK